MLQTVLRNPYGKTTMIILIVTVLFSGVLILGLAKTSTTEFCLSCHEMKIYKDELAKSSHAMTKEKTPIECKDCHIPNGYTGRFIIVKTMLGVKDAVVHYWGDPENLDRREMQTFARRFIPDENCRSCHQDLMKDTDDKALSEIGKLSHEAYLGKNGQTRRGCAGCHFNMAHLPDFDRRYQFNAEFAKNLPMAKEAE